MKRSGARWANFTLRSCCVLVFIVHGACATYYHQQYDFNAAFERGDVRTALETLQEKKKLADSKSQFIYFVNNGLLLSIMGEYEQSNSYFEKAFLFGEDYHVNYVNEAFAYFSNPSVVMYRGEDHEHLMVLYFKALNYLKMNRPQEALVECRRLNLRLNQLGDKYSSEKKYQRDAFIHTLMGIIYQSTNDFNNAFIAYRNAVEIYENDYYELFGLTIPEQLKKDLLNTAWWTGFKEEFTYFSGKFGMESYQPVRPEAELVFFWHNGLAPVKAEWNVNFVVDRGRENVVVFTNDRLGLTFPFPIEEDEKESDLGDIEVLRVAFPRYQERERYFQSAVLQTDSVRRPLELAEDINRIAQHSLRQRMVLEFSKGLLRAAVKKATEHAIREEDDRLGALIGIVNAITEKADTRNWQTLPHSISYARVPLKAGQNQATFDLFSADDHSSYQFDYIAKPGQTLFHTFSSLETLTAPSRVY